MALYSWFLRTDKKSSIKSVHVKSKSLKTSESVKYIENYTMWPTAKIKPNVEITIPSYGNSNKKTSKHLKNILPTKTELAIIKS